MYVPLFYTQLGNRILPQKTLAQILIIVERWGPFQRGAQRQLPHSPLRLWHLIHNFCINYVFIRKKIRIFQTIH